MITLKNKRTCLASIHLKSVVPTPPQPHTKQLKQPQGHGGAVPQPWSPLGFQGTKCVWVPACLAEPGEVDEASSRSYCNSRVQGLGSHCLRHLLLLPVLQTAVQNSERNVHPGFPWRPGLVGNADYWCSISKQRRPDFTEIKYTSEHCPQLTAIDLEVKLRAQNPAFPLCFSGNCFTAGPLLHCSESQKNAELNEPNMKIITPVIFGSHTE